MNAFDQLHPALQHHVVNTLGWRSLRAFQEECIDAVLSGSHTLVLAPTAGGKTEAACFPVLSRMLNEGWTGLSVLYVCPLRALLNNLDIRLRHYFSLVGRRSAVWHGDTRQSERRKLLAELPDLLLTTPESLEVLLVSRRTDHRSLFANVRAVIVDEIHAFAGDDRGWHLLCVLERITRLAGRELQRIGLSATVGNPESLLSWLAGTCAGPGRMVLPAARSADDAEVAIDYVGGLENAATVISRLHRGEKRLVFCDSRARVEALAVGLRQAGVETFVSHSSLSADQRRRAEAAFAEGQNCVIVATSALELGIDVGDLERVIHIDAPATVSAFLQRMGRTGRRAGGRRNCLFLATRPGSLLQAAGLVRLWSSGYVEPITPPEYPLHILAQQIMALALQEGGIGCEAWPDWIGKLLPGAGISDEDARASIAHMIEEGILWNDQGVLWFGEHGEARFGRRNFLELLSVFTSPPFFTVRHGRSEIGTVDQLSLARRRRGPAVLLLAGRNWTVTHVDWGRRVVYVNPTEYRGESRWLGSGEPLSFAMCQAMRDVLLDPRPDDRWSRRARETMLSLREEFSWLDGTNTVVVTDADGEHKWWTFAGQLANLAIAHYLEDTLTLSTRCDGLAITLEGDLACGSLDERWCSVVGSICDSASAPVDEEALDQLKFSVCVPRASAIEVLRRRLSDPVGLAAVRKVAVSAKTLGETCRPDGSMERGR